MDTDWIEAVMRMNECVVAAEGRFDRQVICMVEMSQQGHSTLAAEKTLMSYQRTLDLLRRMQGYLLREPGLVL